MCGTDYSGKARGEWRERLKGKTSEKRTRHLCRVNGEMERRKRLYNDRGKGASERERKKTVDTTTKFRNETFL